MLLRLSRAFVFEDVIVMNRLPMMMIFWHFLCMMLGEINILAFRSYIMLIKNYLRKKKKIGKFKRVLREEL